MFETELEGNRNQMSNNFNITVDKKTFLKALSHVQSIVEKRNIIPILSNIKFVADANYVELTATDMDIAVTEKISATITGEGSLTLPAQIIYDIVRKIPEGTSLNFKVSESHPGKVEFTAGKSNFLLPYLEANEFPGIEQGMMPFKFELSAAELKSMIEKNKLFISSEETRYNLNGIYLHGSVEDGQNILNAVATDGHRLSKVSMTSPEEAVKMPGIIIPRKAIIELNKIIDDIEGKVVIHLSETKILFNIGEVEFISKLIDGNFPEYVALIPKESKITMTIDKKNIYRFNRPCFNNFF
jgi:DNA polymerase-3 subunit beta